MGEAHLSQQALQLPTSPFREENESAAGRGNTTRPLNEFLTAVAHFYPMPRGKFFGLRGLGLETPVIAETGAEAQTLLESRSYDLCFCEARLSDMSGIDLIKWIRALKIPTRFMPILVLSEYSQRNSVIAARDAGAYLMIRKPASPQVLHDHIAGAAKPPRPFIETDNYIGPDRRFKSIGPPGGVGQRATDLSADIDDAVEPNMSQAEIDAMVRSTKMFTI